MKKVQSSQLTTNNLLNWLLQCKTKSIELEPAYVRSNFSNHLSAVYSLLTPSDEKEEIQLSKFVQEAYAKTCMSPVLDIFNMLQGNDYFSNFLIHGSTSDLSTVSGWSDFDSIAVVKNSALSDRTFESFFTLGS